MLYCEELNLDLDRAQQAAKNGPVLITGPDRPELVMMSVEEYTHIARRPISIGDRLSNREAAEIDIEFPKLNLQTHPVVFD